MITKTPAFITSDNQLFATREAAQHRELEMLFEDLPTDSTAPWALAADVVITKKAEVLAILSTRKPRTPKPPKVSKKKTNAAAVNAALQDMKQ